MSSQISRKLDQIEAEMRRIGFWQATPPDLLAMIDRGEISSFLDAPSFEIWLQAVFLPTARIAIDRNALPTDSQVGLMAMRQYDYHSSVPEAHYLVRLLYEFDELVKIHAR